VAAAVKELTGKLTVPQGWLVYSCQLLESVLLMSANFFSSSKEVVQP
jgi:hypothetical protein